MLRPLLTLCLCATVVHAHAENEREEVSSRRRASSPPHVITEEAAAHAPQVSPSEAQSHFRWAPGGAGAAIELALRLHGAAQGMVTPRGPGIRSVEGLADGRAVVVDLGRRVASTTGLVRLDTDLLRLVFDEAGELDRARTGPWMGGQHLRYLGSQERVRASRDRFGGTVQVVTRESGAEIVRLEAQAGEARVRLWGQARLEGTTIFLIGARLESHVRGRRRAESSPAAVFEGGGWTLALRDWATSLGVDRIALDPSRGELNLAEARQVEVSPSARAVLRALGAQDIATFAAELDAVARGSGIETHRSRGRSVTLEAFGAERARLRLEYDMNGTLAEVHRAPRSQH